MRELEHAVERAVIMCQGPLIRPEHLPETLRKRSASLNGAFAVTLPVGISLKEAEKALILKTLESVHYHRGKAAEMLGISKRKVEYLLKAWGMGKLGRRPKKTP